MDIIKMGAWTFMKKLLCGVLALMLLMLGTCTPALAEKLVDSGDVGTIHWELDSKGKLTVTGTGSIPEIPQMLYYSKKIKTIEIGDEITGIEYHAFYWLSKVTKVVIGEQVQHIDRCAFSTCQYVQTIIFKGAQVEDDFHFINEMNLHNLKEVSFPDTLPLKIEDNILMSKDGKTVYVPLGKTPTKLYIPDEVENIGKNAFAVKGIQELYIPASIKSLEQNSFSNCKQLSSVYFLDITSPVQIAPNLFDFCKFSSLTLPPCITPDYMAYFMGGCLKLKYLAWGEGTEEIPSYAVTYCPNLEKIYLPESVIKISDTAFEYSPKLTLMVREGSYAETFAKEQGFKYAYFTPVSGITLSEQAMTLKKGKSVALTAEIAPADATEQTLIWCSSDPKVATVTKGKVKAVGVGSCEIICYASDGSNARTVCSLTVEK